MSDIVISGYHGFANSGDEALLYAILTTLRKAKPDLDVTVLSKVPEETAIEYGVNSIYRYNFGKIRKEVKKAKMLLFGGGSLLQDVTSSKSLLYYLAVICIAQKYGIKTMLYANGIGPITKKINRCLVARILNKVDVITLRDDKSDEELKSLGVTKPRIVITADPAFTIDTDVKLSGKFYTKRAGVPDGAKLVAVSVRDFKTAPFDFDIRLAKMCDYMYKKHNVSPLFIPMQYPEDTSISRRVMEKMEHKSYIINRELSVAEMFSVLSETELVVGMRLHSLIYATTLEIPAMAIVYDPKISAFMDSLNQPDWLNVENFDTEMSFEIIDKIMNTREERRNLLKQTNAQLKKKAEENAAYAIELLSQK